MNGFGKAAWIVVLGIGSGCTEVDRPPSPASEVSSPQNSELSPPPTPEVPPPATERTEPAQPLGYKGIPWGTPCAQAVARLTDLGTEFGSREMRDSKINWALPRFYSYQPGCAPAFAQRLDLALKVTEGKAGRISVSVVCAADRFAGVKLGGEEGRVGRTLRETAGPPIETKSRESPDGSVFEWNSRLAPRGDSVRFLGGSEFRRDDSYSIQYEVISADAAREFSAALARCGRSDADIAATRAKELEDKAKQEAVLE